MAFSVVLTRGAERDLEDIHDFIFQSDSPAKAAHVADRLFATLSSLAMHPARGTFPSELAELGIREYRQVFFKPYRVIYRVLGKQVVIYLIADGRRDMQAILARRLLGAE